VDPVTAGKQRAQARAVHVAGHQIAVRAGRVWLHRTDHGDGDLTATEAEALAATLGAAAAQARKRPRKAQS
jgi:hypothetical protein